MFSHGSFHSKLLEIMFSHGSFHSLLLLFYYSHMAHFISFIILFIYFYLGGWHRSVKIWKTSSHTPTEIRRHLLSRIEIEHDRILEHDRNYYKLCSHMAYLIYYYYCYYYFILFLFGWVASECENLEDFFTHTYGD